MFVTHTICNTLKIRKVEVQEKRMVYKPYFFMDNTEEHFNASCHLVNIEGLVFIS